MLAAAAAGKNPLPSQGDLNRALNAQDVPQISQRMIAQKKLAAEASKAKAEADAKMAEAVATLETAQKRAEEAKAEEERLQGELQAGIENGLAQLHNDPNRGGLLTGVQVAAAGDGPIGEILHLPARQVQAHPLQPVIRHPGVNTAQTTGQPGQLSQVDRARQAVEEERIRALQAHEAAMEAQARDEVQYNPAYDFSFLQVCRLGKSKLNSNKNEIETNQNPLVQGKASAAKSRAIVAMRTCPGQRPTGASRQSSNRTGSAQPPIIRAEVSDFKINHTPLIMTPQVDEEETTKTAALTSREVEVAREADTEKPKVEVITTMEDNATMEDTNTALMTKPRLDITDTANFIIDNSPQLMGNNLNKTLPVNTGQNELIPPDIIKVKSNGTNNQSSGERDTNIERELTTNNTENRVVRVIENITNSKIGEIKSKNKKGS